MLVLEGVEDVERDVGEPGAQRAVDRDGAAGAEPLGERVARQVVGVEDVVDRAQLPVQAGDEGPVVEAERADLDVVGGRHPAGECVGGDVKLAVHAEVALIADVPAPGEAAGAGVVERQAGGGDAPAGGIAGGDDIAGGQAMADLDRVGDVVADLAETGQCGLGVVAQPGAAMAALGPEDIIDLVVVGDVALDAVEAPAVEDVVDQAAIDSDQGPHGIPIPPRFACEDNPCRHELARKSPPVPCPRAACDRALVGHRRGGGQRARGLGAMARRQLAGTSRGSINPWRRQPMVSSQRVGGAVGKGS